MRVYLAGRMGGRLGRDVLWERQRAVKACLANDLVPVDPAASELIDPNKIVDLNMGYDEMKAFVAKDEWAVRQCDALIVLTGDTPSEGTGDELRTASMLHKPIVIVSPRRVHNGYMGFWNIRASKIVETVEEAAEYLAENYSLGGPNAIYNEGTPRPS